MMRRIVSAALATFGIIAMIIGVGFLTFWAPDGSVRATAEAPNSTFIKTDPGVIDLVGEDVSIALEAPDDSEVIVAFGAADDIDAWAEGTDVSTVSGLADWETLKVAGPDSAATPEATPAPSGTPTDEDADQNADEPEFADVDPELLATSDMWLQVEQGEKKVDLSYRVADAGAISLLATTTSGEAPTLTLTWNREVGNDLAVPLIAVGALVTLIGILLYALDVQEARRRRQRRAAREAKFAARASRSSASTSVLTAVEVDELLAQNDELAGESRDVQSEKTAHEFGAGILPVSERAEEFRNRELSDDDRIVLPAEEDELAEDTGEVSPSEGSGESAGSADQPTEAADEESEAIGEAENSDEAIENAEDASEEADEEAEVPAEEFGETEETAKQAEHSDDDQVSEDGETTDGTETDSEENKNA
ncbi:MAG: hypothetical protein L0K34_06905 [Ancrocorticia sp.]|nr:hypothetical protein [Ancrocorticia sp.]